MAKGRVYHWTAPARLAHWFHVASLAVLVFTGFYIHSPFLAGGGETMAWMRFFHFTAMYIFAYGFLVRTLYMCVFTSLIPECTRILPLPRNLSGIGDVLAYYLFLKDTHAEYGRYNPLQGLTYFVTGLLILVMAFTGFAMYGGWLHPEFAWVNTLLGGLPVTRLVHYLGMWVLVCITAMHIYLVVRQTIVERDRTLMSMIDGYRQNAE